MTNSECEECGFKGQEWYDVVFAYFTDNNSEPIYDTSTGKYQELENLKGKE